MLVGQWGLSPRSGCPKQEEAPLGEAALPRDTGPASTSLGGMYFPPPHLLAGFLIGWEKPVSGRRQWVSTQCMLSGGVPVSRSKHQGALHQPIPCPVVTVLPMKTCNRQGWGLQFSSFPKSLHEIVTWMLEEISETEMPSIRFQDHLSFSRLVSSVPRSHTFESHPGFWSRRRLNPFPPSSDFIGKRKNSIHLRMLREKWQGLYLQERIPWE